MKRIISSLALIIASLTSQAACADTYWGVGYSQYKLNGDVSNGYESMNMKADADAVEGVLGINVSPYIAWEARAGFGLQKDDIQFSLRGKSASIGVTNKLNSYFSGYFKPQFAQNNFNFYGLLGYSTVSNTVDATVINAGKKDTVDNGFSYGIGAGLKASENNSFVIEWKSLAEVDGGDIKGLTFGFRHSF